MWKCKIFNLATSNAFLCEKLLGDYLMQYKVFCDDYIFMVQENKTPQILTNWHLKLKKIK